MVSCAVPNSFCCSCRHRHHNETGIILTVSTQSSLSKFNESVIAFHIADHLVNNQNQIGTLNNVYTVTDGVYFLSGKRECKQKCGILGQKHDDSGVHMLKQSKCYHLLPSFGNGDVAEKNRRHLNAPRSLPVSLQMFLILLPGFSVGG